MLLMELLLEKFLQNWKLLKAVKRTICTEEMNQAKAQNYIVTKSCPAEITNAQLYSTQFEVIFCEGLNPACDALEVCDDSEITIPAEISHTFFGQKFHNNSSSSSGMCFVLKNCYFKVFNKF